ncbi:MAG TPA: hypothetical protein VKB57_22240 [Acidimicrobiales bacterium]|nr:hypothetical protein [Acidimicrobiales bacterium]
MLAHAGGAATLAAPTWLLAYGAAALVLVMTVWVRGRLVVAAARERVSAGRGSGGEGSGATDTAPPDGGDACVDPSGRPDRRGGVGHVLGVAGLVAVIVVAFAGPDVSGANLAPSLVLSLWWVFLPLACVLFGDVMAWLDPFGGLAGLLPGRWRPVRPDEQGRPGPRWTAAALLAAFAWWALAYEGARSPDGLGRFLVLYAVIATAGALVGGPGWVRWGEGFGALSGALAEVRRSAWTCVRGDASGRGGEAADGWEPAPLAAFAAVWLGSTAFDLFSGTTAFIDLAGTRSGWARTWVATGAMGVAIGLAAVLVVATIRLSGPVAAGLGWLGVTLGAFLAHGLPTVMVDGQLVLALASDPLGRGWDLFGTATRALDYSPLTPATVGAVQLAAIAGGGALAVTAACGALAWSRDGPGGVAASSGDGIDERALVAVRRLWMVGLWAAAAAALTVFAVAADVG